jgi:subtilisin-like proprotein convertase family protein
VSANPGDVVTVRYVDALDCDGTVDVTYEATVSIDCTAPAISDVAVSDVTGSGATITWNTDELSDSVVTYGGLPPAEIASADDLMTSHGVRLDHLDECTNYFFSVTSTDEAGNSSTDDNLGAYYSFATGANNEPEYESTDTPIPIQDNTTHTSTISVADDETVLKVTVRMNITHTYTGDLDITLISPSGTRVLLVADEGGSGNNFTETVFDDDAATSITAGSAPFTGSYQPEEPLAAMIGESSPGDWTLEIVDDAGGDTGSLDNWALILTYPAEACGPSAACGQHSLVADSCSTGAGDANGLWDAGELVQFSVTIDNDGNETLTGVMVQVVPQTAGVVMVVGMADYPDIDMGHSSVSPEPHFVAKLPSGASCGDPLLFDVAIFTNEGAWSGAIAEQMGDYSSGNGTALTEDFDNGIPPDWTIVDYLDDGITWYADDPTDPGGCGNTDPAAPMAGGWAQVDSDCAGAAVKLNERLITPPVDLATALTVTLEFDHWFREDSGNLDEQGVLEVRSSLTGGEWVHVATWQGASSANPEHESFDLTAQAAGAGDLEVRWSYLNALDEWTWSLDNVVVRFTEPPGCEMPVCQTDPDAPRPVPGGAPGTEPLTASRLDPAGTQIEIRWDDQCLPVHANLLYGPLDQVSGHAVSGSLCAVSTTDIWTGVPEGSVWFLLVGDDGSGAESSWGHGVRGERNGLAASGECGNGTKDVTGSCP